MPYTDIHLSLTSNEPTVLFPGQRLVPPEWEAIIGELRQAIAAQPECKLVEVCQLRFRAQRMRGDRYALRRLREEPPQLATLGLPAGVQKLLLESALKSSGGLVLISGLTGAGKTTTMSATIVGRLQLHGGYCLSIEDPPEDRLEGFHGAHGYCEQIDADEIGGYQLAMHNALRCFPAKEASMLAFGEVRDNESAAELLRIAVDGHLVLTTLHARTIQTALQRIVSLAQAAGELGAADLLADSIQLVLHQRFDHKGMLCTTVLKPENQALAMMRRAEFAALVNEIERSNARFIAKRHVQE